jgi:hypothetical protein
MLAVLALGFVLASGAVTEANAVAGLETHVALTTHDRGAGVPYYLRRSEDASRSPLKSFSKRPTRSFKVGKVRPAKKIRRCYHYVKKYLLEEGLVAEYLPGRSAKMAAKILPKHGFKSTGLKPQESNVGDICVYKGGAHGHGHIEVLTKEGWWYGYGFIPHPVPGRRFVSCFNKKGKVPSALPVQPPAHEIAGETEI